MAAVGPGCVARQGALACLAGNGWPVGPRTPVHAKARSFDKGRTIMGHNADPQAGPARARTQAQEAGRARGAGEDGGWIRLLFRGRILVTAAFRYYY